MDQIIKYNDIKSVNDIVKKFASVPMHVQLKNSEIKFTIANYQEFKATIGNLLEEYHKQFIITKDNVSAFEKDAASIKKLGEKTKKDAKAFINQFSDTLTAQAKEIEEMCKSAYDYLHAQTVKFRDSIKIEKSEPIIVETQETAQTAETLELKVLIGKDQLNEFKAYCASKNIIIKE